MPPKKKPSVEDTFKAIEKQNILKENPNIKIRDLNKQIKLKWDLFNADTTLIVEPIVCEKPIEMQIVEPKYEVSKPFHKFSLEKRQMYKNFFPLEKACEITEILRMEFKKLSKEEKLKYDL